MSDILLYAKATCDSDPSLVDWQFDDSEQVGGPFCVSNADCPSLEPPEFIDGAPALMIDDENSTVQLKPQFVPNSFIKDVSSFRALPCPIPQPPVFAPDFCPAEPPAAQVLYVSPAGSGTQDGTSFANAYTLENALVTASATQSELWLVGSAGPYTLTANLNVYRGTYIYGGFTGSETERAQRNPFVTPTIVDGQNTYRVFEVMEGDGHTTDTVFDSLTIQNGVATYDGMTANSQHGGAILLNSASGLTAAPLTVRTCTVMRCSAPGTSPNVGSGGAIWSDATTSVKICDCKFQSNSCDGAGGALFVQEAVDCTIFGSVFTLNTSNGKTTTPAGGGACAVIQIDLGCIYNCKFEDNISGGSGGAFYSAAVTVEHWQIINCLFATNLTTVATGGTSAVMPPTGGGAIALASAPALLLQCTFVENRATDSGGGAVLIVGKPIGNVFTYSFFNCIFWANLSFADGIDVLSAGLVSFGQGFSEIVNIEDFLATDNATSFAETNGGNGGSLNVGGMTQIYNTDPQFVNIASFDYHLSLTSPALNVGYNGHLMAPVGGVTVDVDLDGVVTASTYPNQVDNSFRVVNCKVDLGCYEEQTQDEPCCVAGIPNYPCAKLENLMCPEESEAALADILFVAPTALGAGDGSTWADAANLASALGLASSGGKELWLKVGVYTSASPNTRFFVPSNNRLYGGFQGVENGRAQRNTTPGTDPAVNTIIDGESGTPSIGSDARVFQVFGDANSSVVFDSLSIVNGLTSFDDFGFGGGIFSPVCVTTIRNCLIENCVAVVSVNGDDGLGGGIAALCTEEQAESVLTVCDCRFSRNSAAIFGGALFASDITNKLYNTFFEENSCTESDGVGGAVASFSQNQPVASWSMINCAFWNNSVIGSNSSGGGALYMNDVGTACILQCTFVQNNAPSGAGGACLVTNMDPVNIRNTIFSGNTAALGKDVISDTGAVINVCEYIASDSDNESFVCFNTGPSFDEGDITLSGRKGEPTGATDVKFVNQAAGNLRLTADSAAARDSGDNSALVDCDCSPSAFPVGVDVNVDLDRFSRVFDTTVDLGAYEYHTEKWRFVAGLKSLLPNAMCPEMAEPNSGAVIYVSSTVPNGSPNTGTSFADALSLRDALSAVTECGTELWLLAGDYNTVSSQFDVPSGTRIYGGFSMGDTLRNQRNTDPENGPVSIVSGGFSSRTFLVSSALAGACEGTLTIFDSLRIVFGSSDSGNEPGGAIFADNVQTHLIVRNCLLANNTANDGGAIYASQCLSLTLCECTFDENQNANVSEGGGAVFVAQTAVVNSYNVTFKNNMTEGNGGAIFMRTVDSALFVNNVFCNNGALAGGAVWVDQTAETDVTFTQCTFVSNRAFQGGDSNGGAVNWNAESGTGTLNVRNSIFWLNAAVLQGQDIFSSAENGAFVDGFVCDYLASETNEESFVTFGDGAMLTLSGRKADPGHDPLFADVETCDLHLTKASPAIDSGDNQALVDRSCSVSVVVPLGVDVNIDRDGVDRIVNEIVDLGAYEFVPTGIDCFEALLQWNGEDPQPCVHGDTLVTVRDKGIIAIRDVRSGDYVLCVDKGDGRTTVRATKYVRVLHNVRIVCAGATFVRFAENSLGDQSPNVPLFVRPGHPVLDCNGVEQKCEDLINDGTICLHHDSSAREVYTLATEREEGEFVLMQGTVGVKTWDAAGLDKHLRTDSDGKRMFVVKL